MSPTFLHLPRPTSRTEEGPRFKGDATEMVVEYDYQEDDGKVTWSSVAFSDVLQFEFRPMPCCTADDVVAATEVRVQTASERLVKMQARWQGAVGWQQWQQKQGGAVRYSHFTVYFDDEGCVDVVAASCRPSAPAQDSETSQAR